MSDFYIFCTLAFLISTPLLLGVIFGLVVRIERLSKEKSNERL